MKYQKSTYQVIGTLFDEYILIIILSEYFKSGQSFYSKKIDEGLSS